MARDPQIEQRLQRWAQWLKVGDGNGFPVMSVLHKEWQPPVPGTSPTMKVGHGSDAPATHRAIGQMSVRMRNTLVVHYVLGLSVADQALRLECTEKTVMARVELAHRHLLAVFGAPQDAPAR